jgi:hypothetical protein
VHSSPPSVQSLTEGLAVFLDLVIRCDSSHHSHKVVQTIPRQLIGLVSSVNAQVFEEGWAFVQREQGLQSTTRRSLFT